MRPLEQMTKAEMHMELAHRRQVDEWEVATRRREQRVANVTQGLRLWPTRYRIAFATADAYFSQFSERETHALRRVLGPIFRLDREVWLR